MRTVPRSGALSRFQDAFARALSSPESRPDATLAPLVAQPAFAVYRNTVAKGCIDALQANFPSVARLTGEEWFRAAAAVYAAREPPSEPSLLHYGASFPDFLAGFPGAAELTYLPGVARLDRLWIEAHAAADEDVLDPSAIARLDRDEQAPAVLHPHAAARWAWFPEAPVYTIWRRTREERDEADELEWKGEGALLTRPAGAVRWTGIDAAGTRFLDACARAEPVIGALDAAIAADPDANLVRLVSTLLEAGAFDRLTLSRDAPNGGQRP